ncbi:phosphoribosylglycinamide formyltransferase [bacterium]|nr:MAG: phosphoribosylglycinamide formyltransferase [bacterium]
MQKSFNIAFLTSGKSRGSNFEAIMKHLQKCNVQIEAKFLIITRVDTPITQRAEKFGVRYILLDDRNTFEQELLALLNKNNVHLVVLAGFMRKLSEDFLHKYSGDIINIHPALLPKFGGKSMYGMRVHEKVFQMKEKFSGASVHYVNKRYDEGEVIAQRSIPIDHCTSAEEIARAVLKIEHQLYPEVIEKLAHKFNKLHK